MDDLYMWYETHMNTITPSRSISKLFLSQAWLRRANVVVL